MYTPLPSPASIRVLKIAPSSDVVKPIICTLTVVENYREAPSYHCLSYCWGDVSSTTSITCNNQSISITSSLHEALLQLRANGQTDVYLWADALCINQDDIAERNQQVSIMAQIYQYCEGVFVWLGIGDESTTTGLQVVETITQRMHEDLAPDVPIEEWFEQFALGKLIKGQENEEAWIKAAESFGIQELDPHRWRAFWNFFTAPWFRRVWVIQEVQGQDNVLVLCGSYCIAWSYVGVAARWAVGSWAMVIGQFILGADFRVHLDGALGAEIMWRKEYFSEETMGFLGRLDQCRRMLATDGRDKVYALLGKGNSIKEDEKAARTVSFSMSESEDKTH